MHSSVTPTPITRRTRLRRWIGATLLAFGLPVTGAWAWSGWNDVLISRAERNGPGFYSFRFAHGWFSYQHPRARPADWTDYTGIARPTYGHLPDPFEWRGYTYENVIAISLAPYAIVPLLAGAGLLIVPPAASAFTAWRRSRREGCRSCGYSREGLPCTARCPECGQEPGRPSAFTP